MKKIISAVLATAMVATSMTAFAADAVITTDGATYGGDSIELGSVYEVDFTATKRTIADLEAEGWTFNAGTGGTVELTDEGLVIKAGSDSTSGVSAVFTGITMDEDIYEINYDIPQASGNYFNNLSILTTYWDANPTFQMKVRGKTGSTTENGKYLYEISHNSSAEKSSFDITNAKYENDKYVGTKTNYHTSVFSDTEGIDVKFSNTNIENDVQSYTYSGYKPAKFNKVAITAENGTMYTGTSTEGAGLLKIKSFSIKIPAKVELDESKTDSSGTLRNRKVYVNNTDVTGPEVIPPDDALYNVVVKEYSGNSNVVNINLYHFLRMAPKLGNTDYQISMTDIDAANPRIKIFNGSTEINSTNFVDAQSNVINMNDYKLCYETDKSTTEGFSTLNMELVRGGTVHHVSSENPTSIQAKDIFSMSGTDVIDEMTIKDGTQFVYCIQTEEAGYYHLTARRDSMYRYNFDLVVDNDSVYYNTTNEGAVVYLDKGVHEIYVLGNESGSTVLNSIEITPVNINVRSAYNTKTGKLSVLGEASSMFNGTDVTIVTVSADSTGTYGEMVPGAMHINQCTINDTGNFFVEYKVSGDVANTKTYANVSGVMFELVGPQIVEEYPYDVLTFTKNGDTVKAKVDGRFSRDNDEYVVVIGFYAEDGRFISSTIGTRGESPVSATVPAGAYSAKAFIWDSLTEANPYVDEVPMTLK